MMFQAFGLRALATLTPTAATAAAAAAAARLAILACRLAIALPIGLTAICALIGTIGLLFALNGFRNTAFRRFRGLLGLAFRALGTIAVSAAAAAAAAAAGAVTAFAGGFRAFEGRRFGGIDRFGALATRDDVERAKPHPDIYLEAARRLGVPPERCIAFEDSNLGLEAAHAAGTMAFMVPDLLQPLPETRARCVDVLPDLHAALRLLRQHL